MSEKFDSTKAIQRAHDYGEIDTELFNLANKKETWAKYMHLRQEEPGLTTEQYAAKLGISPSSLNRIRIDLNQKSPSRYDIPLKRSSKLTANDKQANYSCSECNRGFKQEHHYRKHMNSKGHNSGMDEIVEETRKNSRRGAGTSSKRGAGKFNKIDEIVDNLTMEDIEKLRQMKMESRNPISLDGLRRNKTSTQSHLDELHNKYGNEFFTEKKSVESRLEAAASSL